MSGRHFDSIEGAQLRAKIDETKRRLPLPELMRQLGYDEKHIGKTALCPFHSDQHPSFSVFKKPDGTSWHKCFVGCSSGDEIAFLIKHFEISRREAIRRYLDMAGFPPNRAPKSHEYRKSRKSRELPGSLECPKYPVSHEYPVSNGQGREKALKALAARNACTKPNSARERLWKLVRDLKAVEKGIHRELEVAELLPSFNEWHAAGIPPRSETHITTFSLVFRNQSAIAPSRGWFNQRSCVYRNRNTRMTAEIAPQVSSSYRADQAFSIRRSAERFPCCTPKNRISGELNSLLQGHNSGMPEPLLVQPNLVPVQRSIKRCEE